MNVHELHALLGRHIAAGRGPYRVHLRLDGPIMGDHPPAVADYLDDLDFVCYTVEGALRGFAEYGLVVVLRGEPEGTTT